MEKIALLLLTAGVGVTTLTGTLTLTKGVIGGVSASAHFQVRDGGVSDRDVLLPELEATAYNSGLWYVIRNSGTTNNLVVKSFDSGTTYATLAPGAWVYIVATGRPATWYIVAGSVGFTSLTLTGLLTAVGITSTGAVTTTDGVASGVARKVGGTASVAVASTTLGPTGGTAENTIGTYTILANTFKAGTLARLFAAVRCTAETGATTCTFRLKLGGTTLFTSAAVDLAAGDVFNFDMNIVSRAAPSASSALVVAGSLTAVGASTDISKAIALAAANYATNGALALVLTAQMSASDANAISCDMYNVELVG